MITGQRESSEVGDRPTHRRQPLPSLPPMRYRIIINYGLLSTFHNKIYDQNSIKFFHFFIVCREWRKKEKRFFVSYITRLFKSTKTANILVKKKSLLIIDLFFFFWDFVTDWWKLYAKPFEQPFRNFFPKIHDKFLSHFLCIGV